MIPLGLYIRVYPAIKSPESGDEFPPNHVLAVSVTSNSSIPVEIFVASEGLLSPSILVAPVPVPLVKDPMRSKWAGTANITLPGAIGDYLLICRTVGDSLLFPADHMDKVAITVKV